MGWTYRIKLDLDHRSALIGWSVTAYDDELRATYVHVAPCLPEGEHSAEHALTEAVELIQKLPQQGVLFADSDRAF